MNDEMKKITDPQVLEEVAASLYGTLFGDDIKSLTSFCNTKPVEITPYKETKNSDKIKDLERQVRDMDSAIRDIEAILRSGVKSVIEILTNVKSILDDYDLDMENKLLRASEAIEKFLSEQQK